MKVGKTGLKMSSGEVRHFKSEGARNRFEKVARAYKHGWKGPTHKHDGVNFAAEDAAMRDWIKKEGMC